MPRSRRDDEISHLPLHLILGAATFATLYPVLWVICIAFSGKQTLAISELPAEPHFTDRLRAIVCPIAQCPIRTDVARSRSRGTR